MKREHHSDERREAPANTSLYPIVTRADQAARGDVYSPPSLATEGFIHLSTAAQLLPTARRHYACRSDLLVLSIDVDALEALDLRWDHVPARGEAFPHLYDPLPLRCVREVRSLERDEHS